MKKYFVIFCIISSTCQAMTIPPFDEYVKPSDDPLTQAIIDKNVSNARTLLPKYKVLLDIHTTQDDLGRTPLNAAIFHAFKEIFYELIQSIAETGLDVNFEDKLSITPLMMAAFKDLEQYAQILIDKGADSNKANSDGMTPLMIAAYFNKGAFLNNKLINKGAQLNAQDAQGRTALMYAVFAGSDHALDRLIKRGADVTITDYKNRTAADYLTLAADQGVDPIILDRMVKRLERTSSSPLSQAILDEDFNQVKKFATPDLINKPDTKGITPLIYALRVGTRGFVDYLFKEGADPAQPDTTGAIPFVEAAGSQVSDVLMAFVTKVKNINITDKNGYTALHKAARAQKPKTMKFLIDRGANVNAQTNKGSSPLMEVAEVGGNNLDILKEALNVLLDNGADSNMQDALGNTALTLFGIYWLQNDDGAFDSIARLLLERGADPYRKGTQPGSESFADLAQRHPATWLGKFFQEYLKKPKSLEELQKMLLDFTVNLQTLGKLV